LNIIDLKFKVMKAKIEVTYHLTNETRKKVREIDKKIKEKIESIGGEWYAQGFGLDDVRDICFDLEI